jgi:translation initiation factor IF-2
MNITEIARRLKIPTSELREKLPQLGLGYGRNAVKVNDRDANRIMEAWNEMKRRERLGVKRDEQLTRGASQRAGDKPVGERTVALPPVMTVRDFAALIDSPIAKVMRELMKNGILASLNERIDFDTASIVASDLGVIAQAQAASSVSVDEEAGVARLSEVLSGEQMENRVVRAPIIVVMGHVDHGKTKILDAIRSTHVMETEAGGITQHIGAYQVERKSRQLTFIDTPGHEAFTVMRSRGAKVADIAILVVAADDGVQPQTKEAVDIIKAAGLPYVVALNKIDKPDANPERVKGQLAELNLLPEEWGGKTMILPVSAKTGQGIDELLDALLLVNEMEQQKIMANPNRRAAGTIIESHIDKGEGPVATALVQAGTLRLGDTIGIRGALFGRVRMMKNWRGDAVKEAPPSMPVKILGFKVAPAVGDVIEVPEDEKALAKARKPVTSAVESTVSSVAKPDAMKEGKKLLNIILRADVLGSLEAVLGMLEKIKHDAVGVEIVAKGLGNVTDADVNKAEATQSVLYAFDVKPTASAEQLSRDKNVEIAQFQIIYKLFEDILSRLQKMLPAEQIITETGKVEVLALFKKLDKGGVIGGKVLGDKIRVGAKLRVLRADQVVGEGEIVRIQAGKQSVKEVSGGSECGIEYTGRAKIEVGDMLETYQEESKARVLQIEGIDMR